MSVRLYAVLRLHGRRGAMVADGVAGELVRLIPLKRIWVAVADAIEADASPRHLVEFDRAIRVLERSSDAILPARYGSLARNDDALLQEIGERFDELDRGLQHVAGCVQ